MPRGSAAPELVPPAHLWIPPRLSSAGQDVVDLAKRAGLELDLEQQLMVDAIFSEGDNGDLAALEACVIEARQNGKTVALEAAALADLFLFAEPGDLFVWSAHLFKTTVEAFIDLKAIIERNDFLMRRVDKIREANGEEGFELHDGTRLNFLARSKTGGRGLSSRRLTLDEAFAITPGMMGTLFPTMAAQADAQIRYGSSAGLADSEQLRSLRDRGRAGGDPSLTYIEWGTDPGGCATEKCDHDRIVRPRGCALDDRAKIQAANPAVGRRITWKYIESERRALPPAEFARERLSWWDEPGANTRVISAPKWAEGLDVASQIEGQFAVAVDTDPDRTMTAIGVCGNRVDGLAHIEVAAHRPGTDWVVPALLQMHAVTPLTVVLDPAGAAATFVTALEDAGVTVRQVTAREMAAACGLVYDAVMAAPGTNEEPAGLRHIGQTPLDVALAGAKKRVLAAAWAWDRRDWSVDLTTLVAVTLAHWAWLTVERLPPGYDPLASIGATPPSEG